ncbi:TBC1 domain family member 22A-like [Mustela nigripes]|uniref:TBC1 domain family member 22A-like n=1 Tax=Mustela nigripes TaxID=77151 RepID=UPI002814E673|nr:TBC1 domain family member 22A-like [Mustela nigripes]
MPMAWCARSPADRWTDGRMDEWTDARTDGWTDGRTREELLLFLQNLPTAHWGDEDVSLLLAEAYRLKFAFADAPNHYKK